MAENSTMSDLDLQIPKRYAEKKGVVLQLPAIILSPQDSRESKTVERYKFTPLSNPADIRLFKFRKFIVLGGLSYYYCEIVHANLDEKPVFYALSYV